MLRGATARSLIPPPGVCDIRIDSNVEDANDGRGLPAGGLNRGIETIVPAEFSLTGKIFNDCREPELRVAYAASEIQIVHAAT